MRIAQNIRDRTALEMSAPEIDDIERLVLQAWFKLSTCRSVGMVVGQIWVTAVLEWCKYKALDRELTDLVVAVIGLLDADYLKAEAHKRKMGAEAAAKKGRRS